jgi:hypothetical protein
MYELLRENCFPSILEYLRLPVFRIPVQSILPMGLAMEVIAVISRITPDRLLLFHSTVN